MRTHIEIDDALLEQALALGGYPTKKAVVNAALAELIKQLKRQELLQLRGQLRWEGDLDQLRSVRTDDAR
jgi:Arc/MetJ family transcription regulator